MYKDRFKLWKWSKNLPRDLAMGMLKVAQKRQPKKTMFKWGNQEWTVDRITRTHVELDSNTLAGESCAWMGIAT